MHRARITGEPDVQRAGTTGEPDAHRACTVSGPDAHCELARHALHAHQMGIARTPDLGGVDEG